MIGLSRKPKAFILSGSYTLDIEIVDIINEMWCRKARILTNKNDLHPALLIWILINFDISIDFL